MHDCKKCGVLYRDEDFIFKLCLQREYVGYNAHQENKWQNKSDTVDESLLNKAEEERKTLRDGKGKDWKNTQFKEGRLLEI